MKIEHIRNTAWAILATIGLCLLAKAVAGALENPGAVSWTNTITFGILILAIGSAVSLSAHCTLTARPGTPVTHTEALLLLLIMAGAAMLQEGTHTIIPAAIGGMALMTGVLDRRGRKGEVEGRT